MTKQPTAVVVGTGFIGPVHVEALQRAGVRVLGLVGSSADKSRQASERWGLPRVYADLNKVLADREVDAVHLATPNRLHFAQAAAVIQAGKHVLCEKPLAMTSRESAELVRLASASKVAAGVAYNIRFYPLCHEAAARIARGDVGELLHVTGSYSQDWLLKPTDFNWRVLAEEGGELRAIADIGTHWLDLMQFITGRTIVEVCADLRIVHPTRERPAGGVETFSGANRPPQATQPVPITTEDCGCVMLKFDNGANGYVWVSQVTAGRKNALRFEVAGTEQALAWESEMPNQLWIGKRHTANESLIRDPGLLAPGAAAIAQYPGGHNEGFPDTFKQLFRSFYGYLAAGCPAGAVPFPSFADGHREIVLCEAILQSQRERRWVAVEA